jgi:hypothetical protein
MDTKVSFVNDQRFYSVADQNAAGYYERTDHEIVFPTRTIETVRTTEPDFMHYAMGHELAHGATVRKGAYDLGLQKTINGYIDEMKKYLADNNIQLPERELYGFTNWKEFIAEVYSRPQFRKLAKDAQVWNKTVLTLAGTLGLSAVVQDSAMRAEFEKTLEFDPSSGSQPMQTTGNYTKLTPGTYLDEDSGRYFEIKKDGSREDLA